MSSSPGGSRSTMPKQFDVVVVGGGPAGSVAARTCALGGLSTLLIDKSAFPRSKPCAGGISMAAAKALTDINLRLPGEIVEQRIRRLRPAFRVPQGNRSGDSPIVVERERPFMITVKRDKFDQFLLDNAWSAGVELLLETAVKTVEVSENRVLVSTGSGTFYGKLLVGADGIRGVTSLNVRRPLRDTEMAVTVCADLYAEGEADPDTIEITYGLPEMGYSWVFPKKGHLSVGSGGLASRSKNLKEQFYRFLELRGLPRPAGLRGHWVALGGLKLKTASNRIMLAGDAAGFGDPFTGEGIRWALVSGALAGEAAVRALAAGTSPDPGKIAGALQWYDSTCQDVIVKQLSAAALLTRLFFKLPQELNARFLADEELLHRLIDVIEGRSTYRHLLKHLALKFPPWLSLKLLFGGNAVQ